MAFNPIPFVHSGRPAGDLDRDNLLIAYSGIVNNAYTRAIKVAPRLRTLNVPAGAKAVQTIRFGRGVANDFTRGTVIEGQDVRTDNVTVKVDKPIYYSAFIQKWDNILSHFDPFSSLTSDAVNALSEGDDLRSLVTAGLGSLVFCRTSGGNPADDSTQSPSAYGIDPTIGTFGGSILLADLDASAGDYSDGINLYNAIVNASRVMTNKNVPANGRYCFVSNDWFTALKYVRNSSSQLINLDNQYMSADKANSEAMLTEAFMINGIMVMSTNAFKSANDTIPGGTDYIGQKYAFPWANCRAICFQMDGVARAVASPINLEMQYKVEQQGDLFIATLLTGYGVLRPESCVTIWDDGVTLSTLTPFKTQAEKFYTFASYDEIPV